jgi:hypothetical protein
MIVSEAVKNTNGITYNGKTVEQIFRDILTVNGDAIVPENAEKLKNPDILMVPVGGFYTIDAAQAKETAEQLNARTILPMHYRTKYNADWPISGPEDFLELFASGDIQKDGEILRVTRGDRTCQPKVFMFKE